MMAGDGTGTRPLAESLDVLGQPDLSPDGRFIAATVAEAEASLVYKIPVEGGDPVRIVSSTDGVISRPVWSPDGKTIVYRLWIGAEGYSLQAVTPEGEPFSLPEIKMTSLGTAYRLLPDSSALILMKGAGVYVHGVLDANFWLIELPSGETRQITDLERGYYSSAFDVSPDGTQIVFDRFHENSDIVLIDLPAGRNDGGR
jgi:Tol biopolymer transport system component